MKPEIMLYDEPTSALDPIMTDKINDLIISLRDKLGMTSIVVTHDIGSAYKIADKIAMVHEGKIIFDGTPAEIRKSRNPYIQQFIRGQRKMHYAVDGDENYDNQIDLNRLRKGEASDKKFQMPKRDKDVSGD
jgi:phospholipid/cholesterol/gamma-HCH transport system ATP-binding protein